jgi:hypothetical protein
MAGKDFVNPFVLMAAGNMSGNLVSNSVETIQFDNLGFQFIWTGNPTGLFGVDISLDNTNWSPLPLSPTLTASGSPGNNYLDLIQTTAKYVRCTYAATSGTGTLKILTDKKMV